MRPVLLAGCAVIAAGVLAGCSDSRITASADPTAALPKAEDRAGIRSSQAQARQRFADVALDDRQLGGIRGGLSTGSGMVVNFSFQEATYVNHNLTQSIIVPTMTISPGSATQAQVSAPSQVVQSVLNNGMTSVVSSLGGGGVTNHISNTANNQLVQQVITANIGITGLGSAIQQSVASTAMSRVQAASAQFR